MPDSGRYTVDYNKFYPADYLSIKIPAACSFRDHKVDVSGNEKPIYDVDESYDHITVQAEPGSHWWYSCTIAVPKVPKAVTQ